MLPQQFYEQIPRLVGTLLNNPVILVIVLVIVLEQLVFKESKGTAQMQSKTEEVAK